MKIMSPSPKDLEEEIKQLELDDQMLNPGFDSGPKQTPNLNMSDLYK